MSEMIYKLLDQNMESHGGCHWTLGEWKESEAVGEFCAPGGFHGYEHPLLAVFHNPIHANIQSPRLFVAEAEGEVIRDGQMKLKAQRMRIVEEIPVPTVTTEQRVAYAILCAKAVCSDTEWNRWANGWLSDRNRSAVAAREAEAGMQEGAVWVPAAAEAASAAALAAAGAAWAAKESVEDVVWAAAAWVAKGAAARAAGLDLVECAERALKEAR